MNLLSMEEGEYGREVSKIAVPADAIFGEAVVLDI